MIRNQAGQRIWVKAFNASGYVEDDQANITCDLQIDGAAGVALGNPTQATGKRGNYYYEPTQAQTNGHELKPIVKSSTSGVQVVATPDVIYTTRDAALTGPNSVAITITDTDTEEGIEAASVRMLRAGDSGAESTDDNGIAEFAAASATWKILIDAAGYESRVITGVEISGDVELEYELTPITIDEPAVAGMATVYAYIQLNNTPIKNAKLKAYLKSTDSAIPGVLLSTIVDEAKSDATGYAALTLVQAEQFVDSDGTYVIEAWHNSTRIWSIEATIPTQPTVNVESLIP